MQTVSITFFRFEGVGNRLWAFTQMAWARPALARLPGIRLYRLFGSGTGEGFDPKPNWGVYAVMTVWDDLTTAQTQLAQAPVFRRYRARASEQFTVHLSAIRSWGKWDGVEPFQVKRGAAPPRPIAVLTRATVKLRHVSRFWSGVPSISDDIRNHPGLMFKIGMGEIPWKHQVTFSLWPDEATMLAFAHKSGAHGKGIRDARDGDWFKEQLFARFAVLAHDGTWHGRDPLSDYQTAGGAEPVSSASDFSLGSSS